MTDVEAELVRNIRGLARSRGVEPTMGPFAAGDLAVVPQPVTHTSHETVGYLIKADRRIVAWAPEFYRFPEWASDVDLLLADGAAWGRPIRFAGGVGGHAAVIDSAEAARRLGVRRVVFAHLGRPTIRAMDAGESPPFGTFGREGAVFEPRRWRRRPVARSLSR